MASSASTIRRASTSPVNFVKRIEKDNASRTRRIVLPSPVFNAVLWWWVWYGYFAWWVYGGLWWCWFTGSMIFFFGGGFTSGGGV